jgi:F1F0 ATPase subunit 2
LRELALTLLALLSGGLLGAMFFGGLWWTVCNAVVATNPALWFAVSLSLRACLALSGFYFVSRGGWQLLLASLLGFLIARAALTRVLGTVSGMSHAP